LDNIKVSIEETSGLKRKMTVEIPVEEVDRVYDDTLKEYRRHAVLPGWSLRPSGIRR
jgi:FKBP-type peptidyl-prolyl cis-trans isomerase (trigger factor)